jgi:hypothetical protein
MKGSWRKLCNENLQALYSLPNIIRMVTSRKIRWEGYVAHMEEKNVRTVFCWESQKERDQQKDLDIGRRIILKWNLESRIGRIHLVEDRVLSMALLNKVMNLRAP